MTTKTRDRRDSIYIEEKLDGSCVAVANIGGQINPLIRAGYHARDSHYEMHHQFAEWVCENRKRFKDAIPPGYRFVGEWLGQAHGTFYHPTHELFVVFDLMTGWQRSPIVERNKAACRNGFVLPRCLDRVPRSIEVIHALTNDGFYHGAIGPAEGAVFRCERDGQFEFIAKYVRPDKEPGIYLPSVSGGEPRMNLQIKSSPLTPAEEVSKTVEELNNTPRPW